MVAKIRPAVVVSIPYADDDRAILGVIPHTTSLRGSQFEIRIAAPYLAADGAFLIQGFATLPPRHFIRRLGVLSAQQLRPLEDALRLWLAL